MKVELFFDYLCPYCYKGHGNLLELMPKYPELEIIWRPCEAHPRPEKSLVHSDMAIQGMYFVEANNGDVLKYTAAIYDAHFNKKEDIEDIAVLASYAKDCGVDSTEFTKALLGNEYQHQVMDGNMYAWSNKKLVAVPSYISGEQQVCSQGGILVTKEELDKFLSEL